MLIFVKTEGKSNFSLDVEPSDGMEKIKQKISERIALPTYKFRVAYAGKRLESGTVSSYGIGKEATLHVVEVKDPTVNVSVEFEGTVAEVSIPFRPDVTVRDLARQVRNAFPDEHDFNRVLPVLKRDGVILYPANTLATAGITPDTPSIKLIAEKGAAGSSETYTETTTTTTSSSSSNNNNEQPEATDLKKKRRFAYFVYIK